jgi:hypothetical protein
MARFQSQYFQADFRVPKFCSTVSKRLVLYIGFTEFKIHPVAKVELDLDRKCMAIVPGASVSCPPTVVYSGEAGKKLGAQPER